MLVILGAVLLLMLAFAASAMLTIAHQLIIRWFPLAQSVATTLGLYRLVPAATLFFTFYILFYALTPSRYRKYDLPQVARCPLHHRMVARNSRASSGRVVDCSAATVAPTAALPA